MYFSNPFSKCKIYVCYLSVAYAILKRKRFSKCTVRDPVFGHPLGVVWAALTGNFRHSLDLPKVHLNPWWFVVWSCRPCTSRSVTRFDKVQPGIWGSIRWTKLKKISQDKLSTRKCAINVTQPVVPPVFPLAAIFFASHNELFHTWNAIGDK